MTHNMWNWEQKDWPNFQYTLCDFKKKEEAFFLSHGKFSANFQFFLKKDQDFLLLEILTNESMKTSEIEGEYLQRESIQSSLRKSFGLQVDNRKIPPREYGISQMMNDLYSHAKDLLSENIVFKWHKLLMNGRQDIEQIGDYRTHTSPMQIVSGSIINPKIHFEAVPSKKVYNEMKKFFQWYSSSQEISPLVKSAIAHIYFLSIHPFEDGNGRISRAISEKILSEYFGESTLISLASTIERRKNEYYKLLELSNKNIEISDWVNFFIDCILEAQKETEEIIEFIIKKSKFFDTYRDSLNARQLKVLLRIFAEGINGFEGGMSIKKYISIAKTSRATAVRDCNSLIEMNIFYKTGEKKGVRYYINI